MLLKTIKHLLIVLPGSIALYRTLPLEDTCNSPMSILFTLFFYFAFAGITLTFISIDLVNMRKAGKFFDFISLALFLAFGSIVFLHFLAKGSKFWTTEIASTKTHGGYSSWQLSFYANGSFRMQEITEHSRCSYYSDFNISNDTLSLERADMEQLSNRNFCQKYLLLESSLIPLRDSFPTLGFQKGNLSQLVAE